MPEDTAATDDWLSTRQLDRVSQVAEERGYSTPNEFLIDAVENAIEAPARFTEAFRETLDESHNQLATGETVSHAAARERVGVDD